MTVDQVFIIKKLQNLDEMLVAYSAVTRMPFAICDDESFNDQVWIFTDQDKLKTFAEKYKEEKKLILPVKVQKKDASMFYMNLFAMGINEVVFCDGDQENKIELTKIVRMPDVDALPENRKPILNPQLHEIDGEVTMGKVKRGNREIIVTSKTGDQKKYLCLISRRLKPVRVVLLLLSAMAMKPFPRLPTK